jgi:molybdopterin synthase sulfur carrier subunit
MATLKLFGNLRKYAGASRLEIDAEDIRRVLDLLKRDYPELAEQLLEDGNLRPHYLITLNGHDINLAEGLDSIVAEGDQIAVFSPIAGG